MPEIRPFDARALTDPVDPAAAKAFTAHLRNNGAIRDGGTVVAVIVFVFLGLFAVGFAVIALFVLLAFWSVLKEGSILLGLLFLVPILLVFAGVIAAFVFMLRSNRRQVERRWRLARFSEAVGMQYVPSISDPPLPGSVFQIGGSRTSTDVLRGRQPRFVEVGNYQYTVSNGKNQTTVRFGYIAVKLNVPLPHIVLDASANSITLGSFQRDQHLSLEGDFDRYFRLYCPQGYERDALYLFTPDVMARFIDNAAVFDVEIVDDWLVLYSSGEMSTTDPGRWAWTFSLIAALLDKLDQWERWRDDRLLPSAVTPSAALPWVPGPDASAMDGRMPGPAASAPLPVAPVALSAPPGVAPPGRRLRRGVPWVVLAIIGGVLAVGAVLVGGMVLLPLLFLR